jgi:hypothetical protein
MTRVVIMVWMQNFSAGLGDMLRGTVYLHQLSQQMNFKLIVDTQLHPVSHMLSSRTHEYSNYVINNQSKIIHAINLDANNHLIVNSIQTHLKQANNPDPILITTNHNHNVLLALSHECKQFMRSMLVPNDEFKAYFNDTCNALKIPEHYSIIHVRVGDHDLVNHSSIIANYNKLFDIVNKHLKITPSLFIITDSLMFKDYLKRALDPDLKDRIIKTTPIHLSYANKTNDIERIKETLFDFMLLMNATIIKTHSAYGWVSGFVQWVSCIFNVPLLNLKIAIQSMFNLVQSTQSTQSIQSTQSMMMKTMKPMRPIQQMMQIMPRRASSRLMKIQY